MLLADEQTDRWSAGQAPILPHKLQLRLDVVDQQGHVAVEVEIGHFENQRIAEHRHATDTINLAGIIEI